jgi:hypothetical protein
MRRMGVFNDPQYRANVSAGQFLAGQVLFWPCLYFTVITGGAALPLLWLPMLPGAVHLYDLCKQYKTS